MAKTRSNGRSQGQGNDRANGPSKSSDDGNGVGGNGTQRRRRGGKAATASTGAAQTHNGNRNGAGGGGASSSESSSSSAPIVHLSLPFLVLTIVLASAAAFFAGTAYRMFVLDQPVEARVEEPNLTGSNVAGSGSSGSGSEPPRHAEEAASPPHHKLQVMGAHETKKTKGSKLPAPRLHDGKAWPETRYTGRAFPEDGKGRDAVRESHDLHIQPSSAAACDSADGEEEEGEQQCRQGVQAENSTGGQCDEDGCDEDEEHLPAGQHLLVDIKNVDGDFLDSEERLAEAMIEVVADSKLTLLSYHCHSMIPAGVSCVGVLLESHISFHTWPDEGVITLDLFTCGSGKLVPVMPVIERLFAIPQEGAGTYHPPPGTSPEETDYVHREEDYHEEPVVVWSHVLRGFRPNIIGGWRILENDVADFALKRLEMNSKQVITSTVTPYQQIDVVDVIDPRHQTMRGYERSLRPEIPTYENAHPELFRPNRMVFLEGVIQSTLRGDEAYHEALVHPAMFAHDNPRKVAIIGGGEGSTLREVLKHRTVEKVKMVEIDEMMVNTSREFLPDWSDCSDLVDSAESCFDDRRTDLSCEDALAWFIDRYEYPCNCEEGAMRDSMRAYCKCDDEGGPGDESKGRVAEDESDSDRDTFEVIIMDALDPQDNIDFADALYNNEAFIGAVFGALSDDGILVLQLGASAHKMDPPELFSENKHRFRIMSMIEDMGFQSMHVYEESHCGFHDPWSFLVACRSSSCRFNWFANEAEKNLQIHRRVARTASGKSPLKYFDGATMNSFQVPPKAWETVFCRRVPMPASCANFRGYDKNMVNCGAEKLEAKASTMGESAGRGTFALVDIPKGTYVAQEQAPAKIHFSHGTTRRAEALYYGLAEADDLGDALHYMYGYGFQYNLVADYEYYVDSGILTFVNHGCNGTNNIGGESKQSVSPSDPFFNEETLDPTKVAIRNPVNSTTTFDPVIDRHIPHLAASFDVALRDIKAGEELFQNYLYYIVDGKEWIQEVRSLQAQCRGEAHGWVKADEAEFSEAKNKQA